MAKVVIYSTAVCPFCVNAKQLLQKKGAAFEERRIDTDPKLREKMMADSGRRTVPQIWIGDTHVGGFTDLWALDKSGELDSLLANQ